MRSPLCLLQKNECMFSSSSLASYDNVVTDGISLVTLLCTFSSTSISLAK